MLIRSPSSSVPLRPRLALLLLPVFFLLPFIAGCNRMHQFHKEMVYVSARKAYLRDRVAAVSNRTGAVTNGEALEVLEHGRRFLRVKTPGNQTGWIEQHMVIDQATYDAFSQLAGQHKNDAPAAIATLRDDLYMHITPGRTTDRFYLLPGEAKVKLLERASVPKAGPGGAAPVPLAKLAEPAQAAGKGKSPQASAAKPEAVPALPPPPMEDWWLARDASGHTGWLLANRVDVDVPDAIAQYGEGQRFVGAWQIATINDPESSAPNHQVPEYLTVLAPPGSGLPFDFDQVRLFTWSRNHHRYETGFRLHPIRGFLPVQITTAQTPSGSVPAFSFLLASGDDITTDPETGVNRPVSSRTIQYELIDTTVKRIGADTAPISTRREEQKKTVKPGKKKR